MLIILSKRKDTGKIREVKKKLKLFDLASIGINHPMFINNSLCSYHKKLWFKCKTLWTNKFIQGCWVSCGLLEIKIFENSAPTIITHDITHVRVFILY